MLEYSHIGNYQFQWTLSIPLPRYRIRVESIFSSCFFVFVVVYFGTDAALPAALMYKVIAKQQICFITNNCCQSVVTIGRKAIMLCF